MRPNVERWIMTKKTNLNAPMFDLTNRCVYVAGHRGMVGSALVRRLSSESCDVITVDRSELDLRHAQNTERWLVARRPEVVIVAAGLVGGIAYNTAYPVGFLADNLAIAL